MLPLANRASRSRRASLARTLFMLAAGVSAHAHALDWQVDITPAGDLFPMLELSRVPHAANRAIGDGDGLVSVRVSGHDLPSSLRLRVETPGLREPTVLDAQISGSSTRGAGAGIVLHPRLDWDVATLRPLAATRRQVMQVTLESGGARETRRFEVRLHALDDAPYFVREGRDRVDLGWSFAAYVDPRDPVVDAVLALARGIDRGFDADGGDDDARDLRRVRAVWAALQQHGLRYDAADPALSRGPAVYSQRVRLLGEVWRERRANCIDGSVLIASVLERLGIDAFIVLVPRHALVGFHAGAGMRTTHYLETTLLGASLRTPASTAPATAGFDAAVSAGRARWRSVAARFSGRHGPDYALIDIGIARAYGIIPLAAGERARRNLPEILPAPAETSRKSGPP